MTTLFSELMVGVETTKVDGVIFLRDLRNQLMRYALTHGVTEVKKYWGGCMGETRHCIMGTNEEVSNMRF